MDFKRNMLIFPFGTEGRDACWSAIRSSLQGKPRNQQNKNTQVLCDSSQYDCQYESHSDIEKELKNNIDDSDSDKDLRKSGDAKYNFKNGSDVNIELVNNTGVEMQLKDDSDIEKQLNSNNDMKKQLSGKWKNDINIEQEYITDINVGQKFKDDSNATIRWFLRDGLESDSGSNTRNSIETSVQTIQNTLISPQFVSMTNLSHNICHSMVFRHRPSSPDSQYSSELPRTQTLSTNYTNEFGDTLSSSDDNLNFYVNQPFQRECQQLYYPGIHNNQESNNQESYNLEHHNPQAVNINFEFHIPENNNYRKNVQSASRPTKCTLKAQFIVGSPSGPNTINKYFNIELTANVTLGGTEPGTIIIPLNFERGVYKNLSWPLQSWLNNCRMTQTKTETTETTYRTLNVINDESYTDESILDSEEIDPDFIKRKYTPNPVSNEYNQVFIECDLASEEYDLITEECDPACEKFSLASDSTSDEGNSTSEKCDSTLEESTLTSEECNSMSGECSCCTNCRAAAASATAAAISAATAISAAKAIKHYELNEVKNIDVCVRFGSIIFILIIVFFFLTHLIFSLA